MTNEDYVLLRDVKILEEEEYVKRIKIYDELPTVDKIEIQKKCIVNIVNYLSRVGMDIGEIAKLMNCGLRSYEKLLMNMKKTDNLAH